LMAASWKNVYSLVNKDLQNFDVSLYDV